MARRPKQPPKPRDEGKSRFELRFDEDLYAELKRVAEATDVSVNQLMQGITRWAMKHAQPGQEPNFNPKDSYRSRPQPGCIWFGHAARYRDWVDPDTREEGSTLEPPELFFTLDFTERHVVREPDPGTEGA